MVTIRPFRTTDQAAARALIEEGLGEHFGCIDRNANPDLVDIAASYSGGTGAFFVAELDGEVVGTTGVIVTGAGGPPGARGRRRAHRRAGVATALLNHVADFAARAGVAELIAYTQPEWPDATAFYRSHGFTPYGRDETDIHLRRIVERDGVGRCSGRSEK